jgi:hypothetical protein
MGMAQPRVAKSAKKAVGIELRLRTNLSCGTPEIASIEISGFSSDFPNSGATLNYRQLPHIAPF